MRSGNRERHTGESGALESSAGEANIDNSTHDAMTPSIFQPMPDLSAEQYNALRDDIMLHGVIVPIIVDQTGRILDGNNRAAIAAELGIDCPREVRAVASDVEAVDLAVTLNCARRHLSREQVRHVIRNEIQRRPDDSDRAIARRVGCSPSTVGSTRMPRVSNLDTCTTMSVADAEARTAEIRETIDGTRTALLASVMMMLSNKVTPAEIVMALTMHKRKFELEHDADPETAALLAPALFDPAIDYVLDPENVEEWRPQWDHDTFLPFTETEKAEMLAQLAGGAL